MTQPSTPSACTLYHTDPSAALCGPSTTRTRAPSGKPPTREASKPGADRTFTPSPFVPVIWPRTPLARSFAADTGEKSKAAARMTRHADTSRAGSRVFPNRLPFPRSSLTTDRSVAPVTDRSQPPGSCVPQADGEEGRPVARRLPRSPPDRQGERWEIRASSASRNAHRWSDGGQAGRTICRTGTPRSAR